MIPAPRSTQEEARGEDLEATLWGLVVRLRSRGWQISVREIQRAQDMLAYLVAHWGRPPTDDEALRHLRPIFCGTASELETFTDVFAEVRPAVGVQRTQAIRRRPNRHRTQLVVGAGILLAVIAAIVLAVNAVGGSEGSGPSPARSARWWAGSWTWVFMASATALVTVAILALQRRTHRLSRRSGASERGRDLQLRWVTTHPLDDVTAERIARGLRARARFRSSRLDVRRTVDRSVRAGLRLTPCFVDHKRTPEYLALIEHQGARDVLAAYHAAVVDQLRAHDVSIRRLGFQPRSQLVIDPVRGRLPFDGLQPTSERERLLIFARDWSLRDPLTDRPRRWLTRLDRWSWRIQVAPDAPPDPAQDHRPGIADHVVADVRCLDRTWARVERCDQMVARPLIPALFEDDAELWLEPHPPPEAQLRCAFEVLPKALGNAGWYWLGACAVYPEITYELTVALGRLLHDERGEPVAHSVEVEVLARLPWFRHAFMPDWVRSSLLESLSDGQLAEVKTALEEILLSGLLPTDAVTPTLQVAPEVRGGPGIGRGGQADAGATDRVYLEASLLRPNRLSAVAPKPLAAAMRRQRLRAAAVVRPHEAPSLRVRRLLASSNALVAASVMVSTVVVVVQVVRAAIDEDDAAFLRLFDDVDQLVTAPSVTAYMSILISIVPAVVSVVFSCLSNRRRGAVIGAASLVLVVVETWHVFDVDVLDSAAAFVLAAVARAVALGVSVVMLARQSDSAPASWPVFARRNHRAFVVSLVVLTTMTLMLVVVDAVAVPAGTDLFSHPSAWSGWLILVSIVVGGGAGIVAVTALYLAGIRAVPLAVVATLASAPMGAAMMNRLQPTLTYGVAGALAIALCYRQFGKVKERPPVNFWETRWRAWTWPISIGAAVAFSVAAVPFLGSLGWSAVLPGLMVADVFFLLNLLRGLAILIGRLLRARRLGTWIGSRLG